MTQIANWFERKFDISFPAELFPNLCIRLRGTPARLEEIVRAHSREQLVQKPEQQWSSQEHAGHLLDLEPLWLARVNDYTTAEVELTHADLTNRKTHEAQHNARPTEEILSAFRKARSQLVNRISQLDPALFSRTIPHPRLKTPFRLVDHLYFVAEHDDHHLARMWELLN